MGLCHILLPSNMNHKVVILRSTLGLIKHIPVTACQTHLDQIGQSIVEVKGSTIEQCDYCQQEQRALAIGHAAKQNWFKELHTGDIVYISGPMTGHEDFNRPAFWRMEQVLHLAGCHVLTPARYTDNASYEVLMRRGFKMVLDATALVMLKGWEQSNGACNEMMVANVIGTKIYYEN